MVQLTHLLLLALSAATTTLATPISPDASTNAELDLAVEQVLDEAEISNSTAHHTLEARDRKVYFNTFTHPSCNGGNTVHQIYNAGECHRFKTGNGAAQSFFINNLAPGCKLRVGALTECDLNTGHFPEVGKCYSIYYGTQFLKNYWVYCGQ